MLLPAPQPRPPDEDNTSSVSRAITLMLKINEAGRAVELIPHLDAWPAAQSVFHLMADLRRLVGEMYR